MSLAHARSQPVRRLAFFMALSSYLLLPTCWYGVAVPALEAAWPNYLALSSLNMDEH